MIRVMALTLGVISAQQLLNPKTLSFYDLPGMEIDGLKVARMGDLCKGAKATLVVNVASN